MLDPIAFANGFATVIFVLHPIIYIAVRVWPKTYIWVLHLALFGVTGHLTKFDFSFKNMVIGTILKSACFWAFAFLLFSAYNYYLVSPL